MPYTTVSRVENGRSLLEYILQEKGHNGNAVRNMMKSSVAMNDKASLMPRGCGYGEILYILVIKGCSDVDAVGIVSKTRAEDKGYFGSKVDLCLKAFIAFHKSFIAF